MNIKKFILASLAVFVAFELLTAIVKRLIFEDNFVISMPIGDLVWSFMFVLIFIKVFDRKGWREGIRFGLLIGLLCSSTIVFGSSVFEFIPDSLIDEGKINMFSAVPLKQAIPWFVLSLVKSTICGVVASLLY